MGPKRQPTLDEVAARAGVSRSAASRVINNARHVSQAKREAVERAVAELGFVPNPAARALANQQVGAVVLALSHHDPALFTDPFFAQIILGVNAELEKTELELLLVLADTAQGQTRLQRILRSRRADGVMLMALHGDDPLAALADQHDIPVVFGGRPLHAEPRWYVDADNRGGSRLATEHVIGLGRRHVAVITGQMDTEAATARHRGYLDAMAVAGLDPARVEHSDFTEPGGAAAMTRLLAVHPEVDAVVAGSDAIAAGALRALKAHGRTVPGDVAVVGFDDLQTALHTDPQLTTVHQPVHGLGRELAKMLLSLIAGEQPHPLILPTRLVRRASA
ncbi:transcriptional regulator [Catellatospora methionotrophica]|uniref:Transcriptional regulator n=1 Tax=Catellatospora methionotrophica TaxID=121620 RepID=A0A8J3PKC8_9ACTN|nr:LacI family DNA-binding transcriptional regulator [Catellatospora methionotrophica]GIG18341.1 transcriptional regulator [Catellatospora methionotrophica]